MNSSRQWIIVTIVLGLAVVPPTYARVANGFDLSGSLVPAREIRAGGPPRDGIPALTDPPRLSAQDADGWLMADDRVMGLVVGGEAVAYPVRILNWHEIVNDVVGGRTVVVTYCPLCGSGIVFDARVGGQRALFGVSGLLYKSDVLLFDRATESLFSQILMKAVTGPLRGTELTALPAVSTTWEAWRRKHPDTRVLSHVLPYGRDYGTDPYRLYRRSGTTLYRVRGADKSRGTKEWAYLILAREKKILIAEADLLEAAKGEARRFTVANGVVLHYDPESRELSALGGPTSEWIVIPGYWFALTAFHPDAHRIGPEGLEWATTAGAGGPSSGRRRSTP